MVHYPLGQVFHVMVAGDFDADGNTDVAGGWYDATSVQWLQGHRDSSFTHGGRFALEWSTNLFQTSALVPGVPVPENHRNVLTNRVTTGDRVYRLRMQ